MTAISDFISDLEDCLDDLYDLTPNTFDYDEAGEYRDMIGNLLKN